MNERILICTFGTMKRNDEATRGQYLIKLITEPYTVEENTVMMKVEQHHIVFCRRNQKWCCVLKSCPNGCVSVYTNE